MKRVVKNSMEAEARACYAGLLLIAQQPWPGIDKVLVQCDNLTVVKMIHAKSSPHPVKSPYGQTFIEAVRAYEKDYGVIVMGKHIKGHVPSRVGPRQYVNNRVDTLARRGMKEARVWYRENSKGKTNE
jgi:ribonuclease HI